MNIKKILFKIDQIPPLSSRIFYLFIFLRIDDTIS